MRKIEQSDGAKSRGQLVHLRVPSVRLVRPEHADCEGDRELAKVSDFVLGRLRKAVLNDEGTPSTGGIEFLAAMGKVIETLRLKPTGSLKAQDLDKYLIELRNCIVANEIHNCYMCVQEDRYGNVDLGKSSFELLKESDLVKLEEIRRKRSWGSLRLLAYELPATKGAKSPQIIDLRDICGYADGIWNVKCDVFSDIELCENLSFRCKIDRDLDFSIHPGRPLDPNVRKYLRNSRLVPFLPPPKLKPPGNKEDRPRRIAVGY